jgi:hypothetical protein
MVRGGSCATTAVQASAARVEIVAKSPFIERPSR